MHQVSPTETADRVSLFDKKNMLKTLSHNEAHAA
jgi:hypothetical protein